MEDYKLPGLLRSCGILSNNIKEKIPQKLSSRASQIKELDHHLVSHYPIITASAMKAVVENNTLVFIVDKCADKNDVKDAVRIMFRIKAEKVNTLILPDGAKKAYVKLGPDYNAVDMLQKRLESCEYVHDSSFM